MFKCEGACFGGAKEEVVAAMSRFFVGRQSTAASAYAGAPAGHRLHIAPSGSSREVIPSAADESPGPRLQLPPSSCSGVVMPSAPADSSPQELEKALDHCLLEQSMKATEPCHPGAAVDAVAIKRTAPAAADNHEGEHVAAAEDQANVARSSPHFVQTRPLEALQTLATASDDAAILEEMEQVLCGGVEDRRAAATEALGKLVQAGHAEAREALDRAVLDCDAMVRLVAVEFLGKLAEGAGDEAAKALVVRCINDPDDYVRLSVVGMLRKLADAGNTCGIKSLLLSTCLEDKTWRVRRLAVKGLYYWARRDDAIVNRAIAQRLDDEHEDVRDSAYKVLEKLVQKGKAEALKVMLKYLGHKTECVRALAADAACQLAEQGDQQAKQALLRAMEDSSETVRRAAMKMITLAAKAGEVEAIAAVEKTLWDPSRDVRWMAAKLMDKLVNKLHNQTAYEAASRQLMHEDAGIRLLAIQANAKLAEQGRESAAVHVLNGRQDSSDNVRRRAVEAMGELARKRVPAFREAVFRACDDDDYRIRLTAVKIMASLVEAGDADALDAIRRPLQDMSESDYVRLAAMEAMGTLAEKGFHGATEAVVAGSTDENWRVKHVALKVMGGLLKDGDPQVVEAVKLDRLERRRELGAVATTASDGKKERGPGATMTSDAFSGGGDSPSASPFFPGGDDDQSD
eukprot:TRINITY_DN45306_c0_g1_i1.p1 TRINITY_DN45306_c0_g1~~TRINITY_DN45306_c0_g1_i1.p1  ORF type:complete len:686 (+),score=207.75 TRINITY_DN45306_c0_g1_i1:172-2229(+)